MYCPIGVFDSGYGGLTILRDIVKELPEYDYIYLGDNARTPYGTRSFDIVYEYTRQAVLKLFTMGCRLVIIACNTASAKALRTIQQVDLPTIAASRRVLGVIRPSVEAIADYTRNGHVGIMATNGTVASRSYLLEIEKLHSEKSLCITQKACPMWVPLVENNELESAGTTFFVQKYVQQLLEEDMAIDTILLACTHYPLLRNQIERFVSKQIRLVEQGTLVAKSLRNYLQRHPELEQLLSRGSQVDYFTTEKGGMFDQMAALFMGTRVVSEHVEL